MIPTEAARAPAGGDSDRGAPSRFTRQRRTSTAVLLALVAALVGTAVVGTVVTVPTISTARAVVLGGDDRPGSMLVLFPAGFEGRVEAGMPVRLRIDGVPDDTGTVLAEVYDPLDADQVGDLFDLPGHISQTLDGDYVAALITAPLVEGPDGETPPAPGTWGDAVADVGERRLAEIFLGRGLMATP